MRSLLTRIPLVLVVALVAVAPATLAGAPQADRSSQATLGDDWITTQIQAKYFLDSDIKARTIDVSTVNGVVTLAGAVESAAERQRAVDIASRIDGVRRVIDRLTIRGRSGTAGTSGTTEPPPAQRVPGADEIQRLTQSDPVILSQVKAKFAVDPEVNALAIDVDVDEGIVTLAGDVSSATVRARAEKLALEVPGVKEVRNELKIKR